MGEKTKIEWCDFTWNPWIGCTRISPGCDRCYAADMAKRYGWVKWGEPGQPGEYKRTSEANWKKPLQWARKAREALEEHHRYGARGNVPEPPHRPRVFCASLADWLDNQVSALWRADLRNTIDDTPELDWLLLTKRPENYIRYSPWPTGKPLPPNVWFGFTAEDQAHFDRRWRIVRDIPARVRFCSYEPALGPLRVGPRREWPDLRGNDSELHWLICGGESGPGYREMPLQWEEDIRLDCAQAGIAYFQKQNAGKKPFPDGYPLVRQFLEIVSRETAKGLSSC